MNCLNSYIYHSYFCRIGSMDAVSQTDFKLSQSSKYVHSQYLQTV